MKDQPEPIEVLDAEPEDPPAPAPAAKPGKAAVLLSNIEGWEDPGTDGRYDVCVEFFGDKLRLRKPKSQSLNALSWASLPGVDPMTTNRVTGNFVKRHMSPESWERLFADRLVDPDDPDCDEETIGKLITELCDLAVRELNEKPANRAERRHPTGP